MRALSSFLLVLVATALPLGRSAAQGVLGPGPDAYTLPRGTVRTTLTGDHGIDRERWKDGAREPLGGGFATAQFGQSHNAALFALGTEFNALGVNGLNPTLGAMRLDLRQRIMQTRFGVEYGIYDWLTVGVEAPFVRTRAEAALRSRGDSGIATAGVNPIHYGSSVAATNNATILNYFTAANSLGARLSDCMSNAGSHPECADILTESADVNALIAITTAFATGLTRVYGTNAVGTGLPYVPLAGSMAEQLLRGRVDSMRTAFTRYGVTDISPTTGLPLGAQFPLTSAQLAALVDTGFGGLGGYGARPLTRTARQTVGDVDLTMRVRLRDGLTSPARGGRVAAPFSWRQTLAMTVRLGTGSPDLPDNFIDLGTGSGVNALALRSFTDVAFKERLSATITVGWARGLSHTRTLRVPSQAGIEWLESWRETNVDITPASVIELGVAPRWHLSDYFAVGGEWRYRSKGEDEHVIAPGMAFPSHLSNSFLLSTAALDAQSGWNEHRLAWTLNYSTLTAVERGKLSLPIEIGYTHEQSVASARGVLPRRWTDRIQIRYYAGSRPR